MHREASQEIPNIERDAQAGSEPIQSQFPSRNIAGIGSSSVVVVLERGNLRLGISRYPASSRVECFRNVIVDTRALFRNHSFPLSSSVQAPAVRGHTAGLCNLADGLRTDSHYRQT